MKRSTLILSFILAIVSTFLFKEDQLLFWSLSISGFVISLTINMDTLFGFWKKSLLSLIIFSAITGVLISILVPDYPTDFFRSYPLLFVFTFIFSITGYAVGFSVKGLYIKIREAMRGNRY